MRTRRKQMPQQKGDLIGASFSQIDRRKTLDLLISTIRKQTVAKKGGGKISI
jgi:hypothetical protein